MSQFVIRTLFSVLVGSCLATSSSRAGQREPHASLKKHVGLNDDELRKMEQGQVISRVLDTTVDNEVAIFGVVWIDAALEDFVARQKDIENFESGDAVLAIQKIGRPPAIADFAKLTFPEEDLDDLEDCRVGDCPVKVDESSLIRLHEEVDWSAADAHQQANRLIREMMLEGIQTYLEGGVRTFGPYRDKKRPTYLDEEFKGLLASSPYLIEYDPKFHDYLERFPDAELAGSEEFLYWSKVRFGLKPTVRVSHVVIYYRPESQAEVVIGAKMLYASHYFHSGLELKYLVRDTGRPHASGYYLVSVNRSRSDGLTGFFGGIIRSSAQSEARKGLATGLAQAKVMLESGTRMSSR